MFTTYNVDALVVLGALIGLEIVCKTLGVVGDLRPVSRVEVVSHTVVEGEEGSGCANLSTHVADRRHTGTREGLYTRTSVLDDSASTTLDGQDTGNLEDDICTLCMGLTVGGSGAINSPLGVVQPPILPVRLTWMTLGHFNSQGISAMTSTASAPPTPQATIPRPPALGVCESVPIIRPPGKA